MIQGVHIFSPELVKQQQGGGKAGLPQLVKNQVVDATVLKVHSPTRAELMVAGKRLTAETSLLLVRGDTLQLKVTRTGGFEILKPMLSAHKSPQIPGPVLAALGSLTGQSPFAGLAKLILPLLSTAPDGSPITPGVPKAPGTTAPDGSLIKAEVSKAPGSTAPDGSLIKPGVSKALGFTAPDGSLIKAGVSKAPGSTAPDGSLIKAGVSKALGSTAPDPSTIKPGVSKAPGSTVPDPSTIKPEISKAPGSTAPDPSTIKPEISKAPGSTTSDPSSIKPGISKAAGSTAPDPSAIKLEIAKILGSTAPNVPSMEPEISKAPGSNTSMAEQPILTAKGVLTPARLNHLRDMLLSLSLKSEVADTRFVPRLLEKSGLLWEKSLATLVTAESTQSGKTDVSTVDLLPADFHKVRQNDLKGYLLSILSQAGPEEKEQLQPFREFVDAIEKFQVLNSHSSDSGKYLIPFPIFSSNSFDFGQIFFDLGGKKNESRPDAQRLVRVSVFLAMTNLGALRVDLSVLNKDVSAMFQVEDESVVSFIKTMIPTLRKRLRTQGFQVLQVECRRGTPELISEASLVDRMVKDGAQNLNLVV